MREKIIKDKKIFKKWADEILKFFSYAIFVAFIITVIIIITNNFKQEKIPIPTNKTINEICQQHGMNSAGYNINYEEKNSKILCSSTYYENGTIKKETNNKEPNCLTTCTYMFRKIGTKTGIAIITQGEMFKYPEDCKKYCEGEY
jgi:hypothetical protein